MIRRLLAWLIPPRRPLPSDYPVVPASISFHHTVGRPRAIHINATPADRVSKITYDGAVQGDGPIEVDPRTRKPA